MALLSEKQLGDGKKMKGLLLLWAKIYMYAPGRTLKLLEMVAAL